MFLRRFSENQRLRIASLAWLTIAFASSPTSAQVSAIIEAPMGIDIHSLCGARDELCRRVMINGGPRDCPPNGRCVLVPIEGSNFELRAPEMQLLEVLSRLQPMIRNAAEKAGIEEAYLYAFFFFAGISFSERLADELNERVVLDPTTGVVTRGIAPTWLLSALPESIAVHTEKRLAQAANRNVHSYDELRDISHLQTALEFVAESVRSAKMFLQANAPPTWAAEPLMVFNVFSSLQVDQWRRGELAKHISPYAWITAYHWPKFERLSSVAVRPLEPVLSRGLEPGPQRAQRRMTRIALIGETKNVLFIRNAVPLYSRPHFCEHRHRSEDLSEEIHRVLAASKVERFVRGTLPAGPIWVVEQSRHCGQAWSFVRSFSGDFGWVLHEDLADQARVVTLQDRCPNTSYVETCRNQIQQLIGPNEILSFDRAERKLEVRLSAFPESTNLDYRNFHENCIDETLRAQIRQQEQNRRQEVFSPPTLEDTPWTGNRDYLNNIRERNRPMFRGMQVRLVPMSPDLRAWIEYKLHEARTALERAGVWDYFSTTSGEYKIFSWYDGLAEECQPDCLVSDRATFETFFNLVEPAKLRDINHAIEMSKRYFSGNENGDYIQGEIQIHPPWHLQEVTNRRLNAMSFTEQMAELRRLCYHFSSEVPEIEGDLAGIAKAGEIFQGHYLAQQFRLDSTRLVQLGKACSFLASAVRRWRDPTALPYPDPFPEQDRYHGSIATMGQYGVLQRRDVRDRMEFGLSPMAAREQFQLALQEVIRWIDRAMEDANHWLNRRRFDLEGFQAARSSRVCEYDPLHSAEKIARILAMPCVEGVLVPDEKFLAKRFWDPRERGAYLLTPHRDRVEILLKRACQ